jgi:thiol-disulfide isomerase/thioredoxin
VTRPPVDDIPAPSFPRLATWINARTLRMEQLRGHPVLVEFWDFCRPNSVRTLPYLTAWHERYHEAGLRVIGVHSPGFAPGESRAAVKAAVARLGIKYPVLVDSDLAVWREYDNLGWPARYLFDGDGMLADYHLGEGGYAETEAAIQSLLGIEREPIPPVRAEDAPGASLVVQSEDVAGPYSGPYEAGEVWAVLDGAGTVTANGAEIEVDHPGAYRLLSHPVSTSGVLALRVGEGVICHAVCFTPGLAS